MGGQVKEKKEKDSKGERRKRREGKEGTKAAERQGGRNDNRAGAKMEGVR